jgi:hypothetical protein
MKATQESKINMYNAVNAYCNTNSGVVSSVPAFQTAFNSFAGQLSVLIELVQAEAQVITGVTMSKAQLKDSLCQQAASLAAIVFAFATATNNTVLAEQVNFSVSDLKRLKDDELPPVCNNIIAAINTNVGDLVDYGITPAMVTDFATLITSYITSVPAPRNAVSQRKAYKAQIKTSMKTIDGILKKQMDKLVVQFKTTNSMFYNAYISNREIIDAPTSSETPQATPTQIAA